jgi:TonB family protein
MTELHRFLLGYILNSIWQVPLIGMLAYCCALLQRRVGAIVQHRFWVAALVTAVLLPILSASGWLASLFGSVSGHSHRQNGSTMTLLFDGDSGVLPFGAHQGSHWLTPNVGNALIVIWLGLVIYRAAALMWGWRKTLAIVGEARVVTLADSINGIWTDLQMRFQLSRSRVLISDQIATPATVGARRAVVLLPPSLLATASDDEFAAIFAHESAHIRRGDFVWNILYEVLAVPAAYHPATRLLRTRLADSRELVCDAMAAEQLRNAIGYARSLLRIAGSLSTAASAPAHALGIFEGHNLEKRVLMLLDRGTRLGRPATAMVVIGCSLIFGTCCLAASAFNFQPAAVVSEELKPFAGTWHWMFKGKPFITMVLVPEGDHFSGYMTNGFFSNDADGTMTDAGSEPGITPITRTFFTGKVLHIIVTDPRDKSVSSWTMTLTGSDKAEFFTDETDRPKNLKPWPAERVSDEAPSPGKEINSSAVYHIGEGVSAPHLVSTTHPKFPAGYAEKDFSGSCLVSLVVDSSGLPERVTVVKSLGADFDESAVEAVKQYRFEPAMFKGQPVPVSLKVEVNFRRF